MRGERGEQGEKEGVRQVGESGREGGGGIEGIGRHPVSLSLSLPRCLENPLTLSAPLKDGIPLSDRETKGREGLKEVREREKD